MSISKKEIKSIIVGFRFEKAFRISDVMGEMFDKILHDSSSPFSTEFFPRFEERGSLDKSLINTDFDHFFRITTSDIIFKYSIPEDCDDIEKEFKWFKDDACAFINDQIIKSYKIRNLMRAGIMFGHEIEAENVGGIVLERMTRDTDEPINDADQFALRFGKKDSTIEGMTKLGVDDFMNKISIIQQSDSNHYEISYDFQYHFNPHCHNISDWNYEPFVSKSMASLENYFYKTISPLIESPVEAK